MHLAGEGGQQVDDGARLVRRPGLELPADAEGPEDGPECVAGRDLAARLAEETRTVHRHSGLRHAVGEANHQRMQPRHLVDDDHAGALSPAVDGPCPPPVVEHELLVRGERAFVVHGGSTSRRCGRPSFPPERLARGKRPTQAGPDRRRAGEERTMFELRLYGTDPDGTGSDAITVSVQFLACACPAAPAWRRLHLAGAASSPGADTFPRWMSRSPRGPETSSRTGTGASPGRTGISQAVTWVSASFRSSFDFQKPAMARMYERHTLARPR